MYPKEKLLRIRRRNIYKIGVLNEKRCKRSVVIIISLYLYSFLININMKFSETSVVNMYLVVSYGLVFIYLLVGIGIYILNPKLLYIVSTTVHLFVCFFLILRFHPWRTNVHLHKMDPTIIFSCAILLLFTIVFQQKRTTGSILPIT